MSLTAEFDADNHVQGLAGKSVESAGDVNSDGFGDVLVSAPGNQDAPFENAGKVYLVLGLANPGNQLALAAQPKAFIGASTFAQIGDGLAGGGSVDGDAADDFVISMFRTNKMALFLGKSVGNWTDETPLSQANTTFQSTQDIAFGFSASISGDLNGDGINDVVISAPNASSGGNTQCGAVYVYFGVENWQGTMTDTQANITITGTLAGENLGYSVKIIPDTNGDGIDELLIGSNNDQDSDGLGRVFLFLGRKTFSTALSVTSADARFSGEKAQGLWGSTVAGLGDINGDGLGDFGIAEPDGGATQSGKIVVYLGQREAFASQNTITQAAVIYSGISASDEFGLHSLAPLGDITMDGRSDWAAGSFSGQSNKGIVSLLPGQATFDNATLAIASIGRNYVGDEVGAKAGFSIAGVSDFNGDGVNEVLIGAPFSLATATNSGGAFLLSVPHADRLAVPTALTLVATQNRIQVRLTATDPDAATRNFGIVQVSSTASQKSFLLPVAETEPNSGLFTALLTAVRTRTQPTIQQIKARPDDVITVRSMENQAISAQLTVENTAPSVSITGLAQRGLGSSTRVDIQYRASDTDADPVAWTAAGQVQFKAESDDTWADASISGTTTAASANEIWVTHNAQFQPLNWNAGNLNGAYRVRIKPADSGHLAGHYVTSNIIMIDNAAPTAPTMATIPSKWAYEITVTGAAEALSTVELWLNGSLQATTNTSSEGVFSAVRITLSQSTSNVLSAVAVDVAGNRSATSSSQTVSFAPQVETHTSGSLSARIAFAVGVAPADSSVTFTAVNTTQLTADNGQAPKFYHYETGFDLTFTQPGVSGTFVTGSAQVTITLPSVVTPSSAIAVYYFTGTEWSTSGISNLVVSGNQVQFSTTHFSRFMISKLDDPFAPTIGPVKLDGVPILANAFFPARPAITCAITDNDSHIASWSIRLINADSGALVAQNSATALDSAAVSITLPLDADLADGRYQIVVTAADNSIHSSTSTSSVFVVAASSFRFSAIAGPNPINPVATDLVVGYSLSQSAELTIVAADLRGRILKRWNFTDTATETQSGYHTLSWNCRDEQGLIVPNGLCYVYLIAKRGGESRKQKLKVAVIR